MVFWGDDTHEPSYTFPANYKIGFMYRSTTTADNKKKQGEIYLDGRLNTHINGWGNFKTSNLSLLIEYDKKVSPFISFSFIKFGLFIKILYKDISGKSLLIIKDEFDV